MADEYRRVLLQAALKHLPVEVTALTQGSSPISFVTDRYQTTALRVDAATAARLLHDWKCWRQDIEEATRKKVFAEIEARALAASVFLCEDDDPGVRMRCAVDVEARLLLRADTQYQEDLRKADELFVGYILSILETRREAPRTDKPA